MEQCTNCPRKCLVDREKALGFCHAALFPEVATICVHRGEEPPLSGRKGICNIFFAHCNMQCLFCQNYDISRGEVGESRLFYRDMESLVDRVVQLLPTTENMLGLVSPTHYAHLIPELIDRIHQRGFQPTVVYNTNGYDDAATLRQLAPYIDIYLPDYKYSDSQLAARYSHAADYPQRAQEALLEMYAQKGSALPTDDDGLAFRGIIVRHLVLPGQVQNSLDALAWIADHLSPRLHISLMSQYFPPEQMKGSLPDQLNRTLRPDEYEQVRQALADLGFTRGWQQDLASTTSYRPDFSRRDAFEPPANPN